MIIIEKTLKFSYNAVIWKEWKKKEKKKNWSNRQKLCLWNWSKQIVNRIKQWKLVQRKTGHFRQKSYVVVKFIHTFFDISLNVNQGNDYIVAMNLTDLKK